MTTDVWLPGTAHVYVATQNSKETRRAYERDLKVFYKFLAENDLVDYALGTPEAVSFRDYLVETYAPNGAARVWTTVKNYLKKENIRSATFFQTIKGPKRVKDATPRVPSDESIATLIALAHDNPKDSLIIALLLNGLRAGEVGQIKKDDWGAWENQGLSVPVLKVIGKGMKERLIPATAAVQRAVTRVRARMRHYWNASPFLVPSGSQPMTYRQVEHTIYKYAVPGLHPHALRHHYATRLIRAGVSVLHVQKLLGHSDVSTTQMYVTLDLKDLIEAAKKDPMNDEDRVIPVLPVQTISVHEEGYLPVTSFSLQWPVLQGGSDLNEEPEEEYEPEPYPSTYPFYLTGA